MVYLGICLSGFRCLIAEMNLQQLTALQSSWSLNPELVVPSSCITLSVCYLTMYNENMVGRIACLCFNSSGEWIPTAIIIHIDSFLLTPCANLIVVLFVVESNVGISPRSLGITICEQFNPFFWTLVVSFFVGNLDIRNLPFAYIVTALND